MTGMESTTGEREPETFTELAWREFDHLAAAAKQARSLGATLRTIPTGTPDLGPDSEPALRQFKHIDQMLTAIETRDILTLRRLAEETEVFAYTSNIKRLLAMLDEDK